MRGDIVVLKPLVVHVVIARIVPTRINAVLVVDPVVSDFRLRLGKLLATRRCLSWLSPGLPGLHGVLQLVELAGGVVLLATTGWSRAPGFLLARGAAGEIPIDVGGINLPGIVGLAPAWCLSPPGLL